MKLRNLIKIKENKNSMTQKLHYLEGNQAEKPFKHSTLMDQKKKEVLSLLSSGKLSVFTKIF